MSDQRATSPISVPNQRRPSLASLSLGSQPVRPHPIATSTPASASAGAGAGSGSGSGSHPRRLSITTLGLSGSPTQTSPFGAGASTGGNGNGNGNGKHLRGGSLSSSAGSTAGYSELISEEGENSSAAAAGGGGGSSGSGSGPNSSPFSRRVSFGAQALQDVRRGSVNNGNPTLVPKVNFFFFFLATTRPKTGKD